MSDRRWSRVILRNIISISRAMTKLICSFMVLTLIRANTPVGLAQPKVESGTVFLHFVDEYGNPVFPTKLRLMNGAGDDVSPKIFDGVFHNLPYGDYVLNVEAPAFLPWKGKFYVDQARMRITVGLELGPLRDYLIGAGFLVN